MSDTPISDSTQHNVAELGMLCRRLERELNAANSIIRQQQLLDEENLRLKDRIKRMEKSSQQLKSLNNKICEINLKVSQERDDLNFRIKRLEEWKESAMAVEREWNPNSLSKMLGGQLGESQRKVIQREVPKLLTRIKRLEAAGRLALGFAAKGDFHSADKVWFKAKEAKL
jgi:hypothetical protein